MTGAMMPHGADTVVPVEDTDAPAGASDIPATVAVRPPRVRRRQRPAPGQRRGGRRRPARARPCLRPGGDRAARGDRARVGRGPPPPAGRGHLDRRRAGAAGPAARAGPDPRLATRFALAAQAAEAGAEVRRLGIARDTLPELLALVREAVAWADVVVLSGGVSVGAHDHVKAAFAEVGTLSLWRVAIKPGRPFAFARATSDGRPVHLFGLPGNPVSVFVTFELFVRPVLRLLAGHPRAFDRPDRGSSAWPSRCAGSSGRQTITRVVLEPDPDRPDGLVARSSGGQDSYMLSSLAAANGLVFVPPDVTDLAGRRLRRRLGLRARTRRAAWTRVTGPRRGPPARSRSAAARRREEVEAVPVGDRERRLVEPHDLAVEPAARRRPRPGPRSSRSASTSGIAARAGPRSGCRAPGP